MHSAQVLAAALAFGSLLPAASFSGESALKFTAAAVSFGPRPSGSDAHRRLQAYIQSQLKAFGVAYTIDSFRASTPTGSKAMANIIARIPGASGRKIVISGHYDTKVMPGAPFVGANDGGSSTGVLLELARALARHPRKDDVLLVWLDGEEAVAQWTETDSLYGSRHLAAKWRQDGIAPKVKALINVDMVGDASLNLIAEYNSTEWLRRLIWETAREAGYGQEFGTNSGAIEDDHIPFLRAGIPAVDLIDFDYGPGNRYWHTPSDTLDKLSARSLDVIGRVLLATITKLENRK